MSWKSLDTSKAIEDARKRREEATTSANVGGFAVPFGAQPLRPPKLKKPRKKGENKT
jgi:hypothetical protein